MLPSNMPLLNLILLIDVTFSTPTPHSLKQHDSFFAPNGSLPNETPLVTYA
jgi:hypothetical protein